MKTRTMVLAPVTLAAAFAVGTCHLQRVPEDGVGNPVRNSAGSQRLSNPNALVPLTLETHPTFSCIGIQWLVEGDANGNATGAVEFRERGSASWQAAFPLHRAPARPNQKVKFLNGLDNWVPNFAAYGREQFKQNYLAGSIFNLKPGTQYEVRIRLQDPDGGEVATTHTVTTREDPNPILPWSPPSSWPDTRIPPGFKLVQGGFDQLKVALESAQPGDTFHVLPGKYDGNITISASGTKDKPILITAAEERGAVLIDGGPGNNDKTNGITITGEYIQIRKLSFRNFHTCIKAEKSAKNLVVTNCKLTHFFNGIHTEAEDSTITDNIVHESYNTLNMDIKGGERKSCFGIRAGRSSRGAVIAYNQISLVSDALHAIGRDIDVHNNDVIFCIDDAIELDFGGPNIRVYDNRFSYPGQNGISFQPYIGGPAYIVRNCVSGVKENAIKNRYDSDSVFFVNNTFVSRDNNGNSLPYGSFSRNNIFLVSPGKTRSANIDLDVDHLRPDMDYDLFGAAGPNGLTLAEFTRQTGLEKHGRQAKSNGEVLANPPVLPAEYDTPQWIPPEAFIKWDPATTRPHPDYSLSKDSAAIGAGTHVPNLVSPGKTIDAGALRHGEPAPHYGPR